MSHKNIVDKYSSLARSALDGATVSDCEPRAFADGKFGAGGYVTLDDLPEGAARASLGCGDPVAVANLRPGDVVLDLGSGGGIDVLLSARRVLPGGSAYGLDASADMVALARRYAAEAGVDNVEFLQGDIENIPLPDGSVDVVISNCVLCLSSDKSATLTEAFRVLKPLGRFGISDVVAAGEADPLERERIEERIGCSAGTLTTIEYRDMLSAIGFADVAITLTADHGAGVHSAIVQAAKPG
ncbi:methyltransferase domain-containing protein [Stackebrandtia nassauensis]|uniref:Arsenite methyltransferase n=1 Tax=Stackebrandtia nassauensis (strain DSM 44728 / CIP 108903 / NRRL B-16338 / NBRC 102104 / LLR-40K-21) TaxID=446470 RepID=D3PVH3_STANL|nr:methyltransferase domain-containing protein [Stackebrandtia nassauensis]ADD43087.1 Methyltransferase type 11 [Stackebrandtia nassauensis DSM 44728]